MYKTVIIFIVKKYLYFNDSSVLCYIKIFIIWFSHAIGMVKYGRQFVFKILYYIIRLTKYNYPDSFSVSDFSDR